MPCTHSEAEKRRIAWVCGFLRFGVLHFASACVWVYAGCWLALCGYADTRIYSRPQHDMPFLPVITILFVDFRVARKYAIIRVQSVLFHVGCEPCSERIYCPCLGCMQALRCTSRVSMASGSKGWSQMRILVRKRSTFSIITCSIIIVITRAVEGVTSRAQDGEQEYATGYLPYCPYMSKWSIIGLAYSLPFVKRSIQRVAFGW